MSNLSSSTPFKVVPYCKDAKSSCGLFAYGLNTGQAPAGTVFEPMFFSGKASGVRPVKSNVCWEHTGNGSHQVPCGNTRNFYGADANLADDEIGKMPDESSGQKIDADTITAGLETANGILQLFGGQKQLSEVESVCGKQPKGVLKSKATKQAWANCASAYMQSKLNQKNSAPQGLSTMAWIGIGLGSAVVIGGIIFAVTRNKKGQQVVVVPSALPVK